MEAEGQRSCDPPAAKQRGKEQKQTLLSGTQTQTMEGGEDLNGWSLFFFPPHALPFAPSTFQIVSSCLPNPSCHLLRLFLLIFLRVYWNTLCLQPEQSLSTLPSLTGPAGLCPTNYIQQLWRQFAAPELGHADGLRQSYPPSQSVCGQQHLATGSGCLVEGSELPQLLPGDGGGQQWGASEGETGGVGISASIHYASYYL